MIGSQRTKDETRELLLAAQHTSAMAHYDADGDWGLLVARGKDIQSITLESSYARGSWRNMTCDIFLLFSFLDDAIPERMGAPQIWVEGKYGDKIDVLKAYMAHHLPSSLWKGDLIFSDGSTSQEPLPQLRNLAWYERSIDQAVKKCTLKYYHRLDGWLEECLGWATARDKDGNAVLLKGIAGFPLSYSICPLVSSPFGIEDTKWEPLLALTWELMQKVGNWAADIELPDNTILDLGCFFYSLGVALDIYAGGIFYDGKIFSAETGIPPRR